jgi:uncharacterized protein (TIGR02996 family)
MRIQSHFATLEMPTGPPMELWTPPALPDLFNRMQSEWILRCFGTREVRLVSVWRQCDDRLWLHQLGEANEQGQVERWWNEELPACVRPPVLAEWFTGWTLVDWQAIPEDRCGVGLYHQGRLVWERWNRWNGPAVRLPMGADELFGATEAAFLRACNDDWGHPVPRLVYADWLEEQGDGRHWLLRDEVNGPKRATPIAPYSADWWQAYQAGNKAHAEQLGTVRLCGPDDSLFIWQVCAGFAEPQLGGQLGWPLRLTDTRTPALTTALTTGMPHTRDVQAAVQAALAERVAQQRLAEVFDRGADAGWSSWWPQVRWWERGLACSIVGTLVLLLLCQFAGYVLNLLSWWNRI